MKPFFESFVNFIAPVYPQAKRWLHSFNGGVFPRYYKELSAGQPIREKFIPQLLRIPLHQQVGSAAEMLVEVGEQVQKNQLIARSSKDAGKALVVPIHAPTSGIIKAIGPATLPHPSGLQEMTILFEPDQQDSQIDNILKVDGENPESIADFKKIILNAGIIGMGGAGFPTYAKIPHETGKIHTLLINGAECEPFITCDDLLMQTDADEIIQGAIITACVLEASKIICGIESNKPSAIKAMQAAAKKYHCKDIAVEIAEVQSVYPMGGQKQLTQELTGIEIPKHTHAIDHGLLMMNVATYKAIYRAIRLGEPLTSRLVSVTGLGLNKPFNINALIGTSFADLVELADPKTPINYPLIMGGPMMGFKVKDNQVPILKTTNCVLANPPEPAEMQMPCIRCGECMDACPVNLLPQQMYWHSQAHEFDKVEKLNVFDCIECGCCSYVCPSHIPLVQYYRNAKSSIKEIKAEEKAVELAKQRHEFKLARIEREKQEREARLKAKKEAVKKQAALEKASKASAAATENATDKPKKSPAAARAAAAKRAASKNGAEKAMPSARQKAIEAAKQKALKAADQENTETKSPENNNSAKSTARDAAKTSARTAAMLAAKKRAAAKKSATEKNSDKADNKQTYKPAVAEKTDTKVDPKAAAKEKALLAAKKRAAAIQAKKDKNNTASQIEQTTDLTENTPATPASEKEQARKAAMQAAKEAAKKRAIEKTKARAKNDDDSLESKSQARSTSLEVSSEVSSKSSAELSAPKDDPLNKKALAMQKAKQAAAKRAAAKKQAAKNNVDAAASKPEESSE